MKELNKRKLLCFTVCFNLFLSISSYSQSDTLMSYLEIAAQNNPALKAKYNKYLASLQRVPQVGSLPDPDLSFGYFIQPMELVAGKQRAQLQLMQMFPWWGTLKAAKNEATQMAKSDFETFRAERDELFFNVRKSYFQLFLTDRQLEVNDSTLTLLKSIENLLLAKIKTGNSGTTVVSSITSASMENIPKGNAMKDGQGNSQSSGTSMGGSPVMGASGSTLSDLLKLKVEMASSENAIVSLKKRRATMIVQLNLLLNRPTETPVVVPEKLSLPDIDYQSISLFDSIKQNNPMMNMSKADVAAYRNRQTMNRKMGYPMVGIGINYMVINKSSMSTSLMNGKDMVMLMLSVKLPIYREKYSAAIREAQMLENAANDNLSNTQNMLFMEFTDTKLAIDEAERDVRLAQQNAGLLRQSFAIQQVQYATANSGFEELLRTQQQLLDYRLNQLQFETDKRIAIAHLQKLLSN